jgi:hypothetical protein
MWNVGDGNTFCQHAINDYKVYVGLTSIIIKEAKFIL